MQHSRIMGGDTSDNRRSTSPSGDLQQDGDSQAQRDGTEAASEEAPLEDSSRETPSFASKEALENSSEETAMAVTSNTQGVRYEGVKGGNPKTSSKEIETRGLPLFLRIEA